VDPPGARNEPAPATPGRGPRTHFKQAAGLHEQVSWRSPGRSTASAS